ncbi:sugar ABC transporter ATP-binding protein [Bradyrhizobium sp. Gha]|uniref:sugar ABC transporter ATP-binding protein n=1 Tax=Bradyrhizobium sp. Gha TaxID=1855318 RepID=UPI0008E894BD|nr:sugar ABC transporter ATP-binding protein [Bradyrhizobium sp. Gha]SFJ72210.1 monosaccharide ABC transporter ATP-binding protein, CUT2 family [Bradyrhizobium sp. Gha]
MAPLLSMRAIEKRFGGVAALRSASLDVEAGEVHALIGQNGAGKSTLIKILTGYHPRDGGEILFAGAPVAFSAPQDAQAAGISTIYQEINLVPYRSVTENICLGREKRRFGLLDWASMHVEAKELLSRFNMSGVDVRRPLLEYPTAVQQIVAIARAIGFAARLVIMDEPTSSLDDKEVAVLFEVIRQLKSSGVSVIFVSHKLDELYAVCDRVTIMRDGRTVLVAPMAEVSRMDLVTTMLGRELSQTLHAGASERTATSTAASLLEVHQLAGGPKVRDVSFTVRPAEIVGLAGLLGSGRTETVRMLFGADQPERGTIRFQGHEVHTPAQAISAGMGFCSEDRKVEGIVPWLSLRENIVLALMPQLSRRGIIDEARSKSIADAFVARLGIRCSSPEQPVGELSGGNQQKVLLARWLCMSPKLLILDEPTRGIDVGAKAEILGLVRQLAHDGLGVLMISSELEELIEAASRIFVLRDGITVAEMAGDRISEGAVMTAMAHGPGLADEIGSGSAGRADG